MIRSVLGATAVAVIVFGAPVAQAEGLQPKNVCPILLETQLIPGGEEPKGADNPPVDVDTGCWDLTRTAALHSQLAGVLAGVAFAGLAILFGGARTTPKRIDGRLHGPTTKEMVSRLLVAAIGSAPPSGPFSGGSLPATPRVSPALGPRASARPSFWRPASCICSRQWSGWSDTSRQPPREPLSHWLMASPSSRDSTWTSIRSRVQSLVG